MQKLRPGNTRPFFAVTGCPIPARCERAWKNNIDKTFHNRVSYPLIIEENALNLMI